MQISVNDDGCDASGLVYCGAVTATVSADEPWDAFVAHAVAHEWVGVEAFSGLSGTVGEVVAANREAFGLRVSEAVESVRAWDIQEQTRRYFPFGDCEFDADGSRFTRQLLSDGTPRFTPVEVSFLLKQGDVTPPIRNEALAQSLGIELRQRVSLTQVRDRLIGRTTEH